MGRKAINGAPMSQAERNKRYRQKVRQELLELRNQSSKTAPFRAVAGPSGKQVSAHDVDPRQTDLEQFIDSSR